MDSHLLLYSAIVLNSIVVSCLIYFVFKLSKKLEKSLHENRNVKAEVVESRRIALDLLEMLCERQRIYKTKSDLIAYEAEDLLREIEQAIKV